MSTAASPVAIWGTGGHPISVLDTALANHIHEIVFVDAEAHAEIFEGFPLISYEDLVKNSTIYQWVIAVGDNSTRQHISLELGEAIPDIAFTTLVHPSATVSSSAHVAPGTVIFQGAIVGAKANIGRHCIISTGASMNHESRIGDFSSLAPRAVTGGRVTIGDRSAIGIAAAIRHGINIGHDSVVDSACYDHPDLPENVVAYGIPAQIIRSRAADDSYLA